MPDFEVQTETTAAPGSEGGPEIVAEIHDKTKNLEAASEWARAMVASGLEITVQRVVTGRRFNRITRQEEEQSHLHGIAW